jgi:uncharacterized membrane protein
VYAWSAEIAPSEDAARAVQSDATAMKLPSFLRATPWWIGLGVCVFYGGYALYMGIDALLALLGLTEPAHQRASMPLFTLHTLAGGIALLVGPLQFNASLRNSRRALHRALGRIYVGAVWLASLAGLWISVILDASPVAKLGFAAVAITWSLATTLAFLRIRSRKIVEHRAWMARSFAMSLFFITFSFWVPEAANGGRHETVYAIGVWASALLNLAVAEAWLRLRGRGLPSFTLLYRPHRDLRP